MAICTGPHVYFVNGKQEKIVKHHYYIAGICITDPKHQGGLESFLRGTFPYHHSENYAASKRPQSKLISQVRINI